MKEGDIIEWKGANRIPSARDALFCRNALVICSFLSSSLIFGFGGIGAFGFIILN